MGNPDEADALKSIEYLVRRHEDWRQDCLNLCAAENAMSPTARRLLCSDLAQRYGDYTGRDLRARKYYGTREIVELEEAVAALARQVFRAQYVELRPLSGHVAGDAVMMALCRPRDAILELGRRDGGHRLATKLASSPMVDLRVEFLPFDPVTFNVDVSRTMDMVRELHPRLIILGASNFLFPNPVQELAGRLSEFPETILVYDASHVLGLIAGGRFQDPLREGAQLVLAGTQKSFPGPQGGLIYSNSEPLMEQIGATIYPALISNHHLARLPSLGVALAEMKAWGADYADQVIRNARALGTALADQQVPLVAGHRGFTASHTVLIRTANIGTASELGHLLESANIIVTAIRLPEELGGEGLRLGVAELTRRGADEASMIRIAELVGDVLLKRQSAEGARGPVSALAAQLSGFRFCRESA